MEPWVKEGLAAIVEFNLNFLQLMAVITLIARWFKIQGGDFVIAINRMMDFFYRPLLPICRLINKSSASEYAPIAFLAIAVPLQMISVKILRDL